MYEYRYRGRRLFIKRVDDGITPFSYEEMMACIESMKQEAVEEEPKVHVPEHSYIRWTPSELACPECGCQGFRYGTKCPNCGD